MTRSASEAPPLVTVRRLRRCDRIGLVAAARARSSCSSWRCAAPGATSARRVRPGSPTPTAATRRRSSRPQPGADPISLLAWLFTPIFQVVFIILVAVYHVPREPRASRPHRLGDRRADPASSGRVVIPLYRKQLVSQRRMQLLQPEIKEIQKRYKGDAMKARRRAAGALQGARRQPARRLPPAAPPDAAAVHHVLGLPERA